MGEIIILVPNDGKAANYDGQECIITPLFKSTAQNNKTLLWPGIGFIDFNTDAFKAFGIDPLKNFDSPNSESLLGGNPSLFISPLSLTMLGGIGAIMAASMFTAMGQLSSFSYSNISRKDVAPDIDVNGLKERILKGRMQELVTAARKTSDWSPTFNFLYDNRDNGLITQNEYNERLKILCLQKSKHFESGKHLKLV